MRHTSADKLSSGSADGPRSLRYSTNKIPPPLEKFYLLIFYHHCLLFYFPIFKLTHFSVKFYLMLSIFTCIFRQVRFIADISQHRQLRRWCTILYKECKISTYLGQFGLLFCEYTHLYYLPFVRVQEFLLLLLLLFLLLLPHEA